MRRSHGSTMAFWAQYTAVGLAYGSGWQEYCRKPSIESDRVRPSQEGIRMTKLVILIGALAMAVPAVCSGQDPITLRHLEIDRAELTRLLDHYDALSRSTAYSEALREEVRVQADMIRERLRTGDFRAGDRIALFIEGEQPLQWDTLTIEAGPQIVVPTLGPITLQGVLRSELESHLSTEIGRFVQTPRVQARALIRLSVMGVVRPGFYTLPADVPLSDVVMLTGGPAAGADPGRIRIERGQNVLWSVEELLVQVADGRTLDDLGLQAGDRIILPGGIGPGGAGSSILPQVLRTGTVVLFSVLIRELIR